MDGKDCFANALGKCQALRVKKCSGPTCGFYKTEVEYRQGKEKAIERIRTLSEEKRRKYAENYYHGQYNLFKV